MHEMIARRDFRNNAPEFVVRGDLRSDFARQQLRAGMAVRAGAAVAATQDRDCGFVAGSFEREDCLHRCATVVPTAEAKKQALGTSASTAIF